MNHDYINQFNLIDQYVLGKLTADEAVEFEDHFIDCPACIDQLNTTRSLIQDLRGLVVQEALSLGSRSVPATPRWRMPLLAPVRLWVAVACCCIVIAGAFTFWVARRSSKLEAELRQAKEETSVVSQQYQRQLETAGESERQHKEDNQQLTQRVDDLEKKLKTEERDQSSVRDSGAPEVNFPIFALVSVTRAQTPAPVEISPPASSSGFALSISIGDTRDFSVYRVTIVNSTGRIVLKRDGFKADAYHSLSLSLKSNFFAPGNYDLTVEGLTQSHEWTTVGTYPFRVVKRR
jgi:hypothetical protein